MRKAKDLILFVLLAIPLLPGVGMFVANLIYLSCHYLSLSNQSNLCAVSGIDLITMTSFGFGVFIGIPLAWFLMEQIGRGWNSDKSAVCLIVLIIWLGCFVGGRHAYLQLWSQVMSK